jgi:diguanylate cyclase
VLAPAAFLDVALETGLIVPIGRSMLERACRAMTTWSQAGAEPPWVSVNIDAQQVRHDGFVREVADVLASTGAPAQRVRLELTESGFLDRGSVEAAHALRTLGVRLAVDDFGTGYSSLQYLRRLPIDVVKMDRSFLLDVESDEQAAAVVNAIVDLSHALELTVVAEGVETPEQFARLAAMGCDALQGFLFGRPIPAQDVHGFLASADAPHAAAMQR